MNANENLTDLISAFLAPLGYDVVWLEAQVTRERILRIYIDHLEEVPGRRIGIEDCVRVTKALEEPLEQHPAIGPEVEKIFKGNYELEVSSPGIDRPLRRAKDFERFAGHEARVHIFRPLTADECGNSAYQAKNPRQKNFLGIVLGIAGEKLRLALSTGTPGKSRTGKSKDKAGSGTTNSVEEVTIPLPLISKANLEPRFDDFESSERELKS